MNLRRTFLGLGLLTSLGLVFAFTTPPSPRSAALAPAPTTYVIDSVHSTVIFRVKHLGVSYSYGRFEDISGTIVHDKEKPEGSKVDVTIKADSLDTANAKRDGHLKSPDFFDVKQFPTATFTSKSVKKAGENKVAVSGDLTLHGVTKPVTLDAEQIGMADTEHGSKAGFHGTFTVKRSDFGMTIMPDMLGDEVLVTVSLEADKK